MKSVARAHDGVGGVQGQLGELGAGPLDDAGVPVLAAPRRVGVLAGLIALRPRGARLRLGPRGIGRAGAGPLPQGGRALGLGREPGQRRRPFARRSGRGDQARPVGLQRLGPRIQVGHLGVGGRGPGGGVHPTGSRRIGGIGQLAELGCRSATP